MVININGRKLIINNYLLEDSHVCSIDYTEIKKTPLSYYLSQKTVDMYNRLFKQEGISLLNDMHILTSVYPNHECPAPYSEVIKVNDQLLIPDQNYVLVFKSGEISSAMINQKAKEESLLKYCHEMNPEQVYGGSSKESCYFEGLDLKSAYSKLITFGSFEHSYLKEKIPVGNDSYRTFDRNVSYQETERGVIVSVFADNERVIYSFNE